MPDKPLGSPPQSYQALGPDVSAYGLFAHVKVGSRLGHGELIWYAHFCVLQGIPPVGVVYHTTYPAGSHHPRGLRPLAGDDTTSLLTASTGLPQPEVYCTSRCYAPQANGIATTPTASGRASSWAWVTAAVLLGQVHRPGNALEAEGLLLFPLDSPDTAIYCCIKTIFRSAIS